LQAKKDLVRGRTRSIWNGYLDGDISQKKHLLKPARANRDPVCVVALQRRWRRFLEADSQKSSKMAIFLAFETQKQAKRSSWDCKSKKSSI